MEARALRQWLVQTYRADVDLVPLPGWPTGGPQYPCPPGFYAVPRNKLHAGVPACRCYRCGLLLTVDTVIVDQILPNVGAYHPICRPVCRSCWSTDRKCGECGECGDISDRPLHHGICNWCLEDSEHA